MFVKKLLVERLKVENQVKEYFGMEKYLYVFLDIFILSFDNFWLYCWKFISLDVFKI
ncbi:hypothetical protein MFS40622_1219 [Methanocaldococcus sp. FS406-22]|nr:hypothetical protein MFS40622_1219 [Methanocaldococcus sp. FS406-22]